MDKHGFSFRVPAAKADETLASVLAKAFHADCTAGSMMYMSWGPESRTIGTSRFGSALTSQSRHANRSLLYGMERGTYAKKIWGEQIRIGSV